MNVASAVLNVTSALLNVTSALLNVTYTLLDVTSKNMTYSQVWYLLHQWYLKRFLVAH